MQHSPIEAPIVDLEGVGLTLTSRAGPVEILRDVTFKVPRGQSVALVGPSGSGKTSLLMIVAGLETATSGAVTVAGRPMDEPRTDIGIMFQDNTLVPWRTVWGNVALQLELRGIDPKSRRTRIDDLLASVKLDGFADRHPYELSGGMQQRAAFCQAMVHDPDTLLLDEPLGKLDAMTRESIRTDLQRLWMEKRPTVIFVTHSIEEAVYISDRIVLLSRRPGRVSQIIEPSIDRSAGSDAIRRHPTYVDTVEAIWDGLRRYVE